MSYPSPRRSIFITLSSVLLILAVTLLPFNFTAEGVTIGYFVHSFFSHRSGLSDIIANLFLFMPFGIDLAYEFRQRRVSKRSTLLWVIGFSALLSLTVETLQVFLPGRAPSWIDISANTTSGALGVIGYLLWCRLFPTQTIVTLIRKRLTPQVLAGLSILWFVLTALICLVLQQELKIGTWHFPLAFMFLFYGVFFVPMGIVLALMMSVLKGEPKLYLSLAGVGVVFPAVMIEILLRGADLRKVNLLVSILIPLFTMLVVRSRLGHLLRY